MTTVQTDLAHSAPIVRTRDWKGPIVFGALIVLLAAALVLGDQTGSTTYRLAAENDFFSLPEVSLSVGGACWVVVVLLLACLGFAIWRSLQALTLPLWLAAVFAVLWLVGLLTWAAAGGTIPVVGLLAGAIALAVPLVFGALAGVLGERAGVVNIAIDSQLLLGAFGAALVGSLTHSAFAGLIAAMVAGSLIALILGVFAITYFVDQVIVGVVLNVLVTGLTNFLYSEVLTEDSAKLNSPPSLHVHAIPVLGDLPLIGPILFRQTVIVYLMYVVVVLVAWALYRTKWGLRVRAVGEHPRAADTVGIKVNRTRYTTILIAGAIAGIGGAFYTLVSVSQFNRELTGGAGYIALAAVIFGKWDPVRATLAALLFGFASNLEGVLSVIGSPLPSQFMLMLPYLVTIFAVAGLVGKSRAPAADGIPYKVG
ncbi:MAG: ABC transporter permease [Nocardioides sp.]|uniref:ABC transporter permease n=1 Tax=Nocardioides sp. TaxID=35761 RepID=UPI0039E676B2